jgi:hypothetical protein
MYFLFIQKKKEGKKKTKKERKKDRKKEERKEGRKKEEKKDYIFPFFVGNNTTKQKKKHLARGRSVSCTPPCSRMSNSHINILKTGGAYNYLTQD